MSYRGGGYDDRGYERAGGMAADREGERRHSESRRGEEYPEQRYRREEPRDDRREPQDPRECVFNLLKAESFK